MRDSDLEGIGKFLKEYRGWVIAATALLVFFVFMMVMPGVVCFIVLVSMLWAMAGLAGWGIGRMNGKIEDADGVPFYKEPSFYEHISRGPISLYQYTK